MKNYLYLAVNFFTIIICFIYAFHRKVRFDKYFIPFLKASLLVAVPFILWDIWFAANGVWWFNERYLTGFRLLNLPVEEWLFFICIPFSCVFTYYCLDLFLNLGKDRSKVPYGIYMAIFLCFGIAVIHYDKLYTFVTFFTTGLSLVFLKFVVKFDSITKITAVYAALLLPFLVVNGILTGTGLEEAVVNYNPEDFMKIRILTIPVEDAVYGYELVLWNIFFFRKFSKNIENNE
ncbi:lycopene cyclase domain-containing protein [Sinomicrobium sp. M5D2P9]